MYVELFLCLYIDYGWQRLFFMEGVNRVAGCIDEIMNLLNKTTSQSPRCEGGDRGIKFNSILHESPSPQPSPTRGFMGVSFDIV